MSKNSESSDSSKDLACNGSEISKGNNSALDSAPHVVVAVQPAPTASVPLRIWCVLFISSFGVFMASVSTSALIIAFPVLLADLHMTINTMMWVLLVLLLMIGAIVPIAGKVGDIFGQAKVYVTGYFCFVIGSLGAGFVKEENQGNDLIAARVVIGFGAALLFTNSSAILTNGFAPYNKVGLSQGVFQLCAAMGIVLGPLIGGGLAESNWRWIFWFNVPPGGLCAILACFVVQDSPHARSANPDLTVLQQMRRFDWLGGFTYCLGLILILIAMIQGVVADPVLSQQSSLIGLIVGGCCCGIIFIVDQFYAADALIPPSIFLNRVFLTTTISGTFMAFARNSITYNMIFFLQGPFGMDPLKAGINLIPYGIGIMVAGFGTGALADRLGIRTMAAIGPLICLAGCACLSVMTQATGTPYVSGILFLTGFGVGTFQSPNSTANMLSVEPRRRGVAAAVGMLTMTFCMMVGIVLTFSFVLHSMSAEDLFNLFIYGGAATNVQGCLDALARDYYFVIAACACASIASCTLPGDLQDRIRHRPAAPPAGAVTGDATGDKRGDVDPRVRALAEELRRALAAQATLVLPGCARHDPQRVALRRPSEHGDVILRDLADPPAEWHGRDVRAHVAADALEDVGALVAALRVLCEEGVAREAWDEAHRMHTWTLLLPTADGCGSGPVVVEVEGEMAGGGGKGWGGGDVPPPAAVHGEVVVQDRA